MAGKISELTELTTPAADDYLEVLDTSATANKKIRAAALRDGPPGVSSALASDWSTTEPQFVLVTSGSFTATSTTPRIVVSAQGRTTGVQHAPFSLLVGPGVSSPLVDPTDPMVPKAGVEWFQLGSVAGEFGVSRVGGEFYPANVDVGETVRWEIRTGIVGYQYIVSGLGTGNVTVGITPDDKKLYALTAASKVVPIVLGRSMENYFNIGAAGEYLPAVPHAFTLPFSLAFKSDSTRCYVTDYSAGQVVVIDVETDRAITAVSGLGNPVGAAVNGDDTVLYVANLAGGAGSIKLVNLSTHAVTTQSLASNAVFPSYVALSPDETKLAVACQGGGGVTNRVYIYTITGGAWTLAQTCVVGGADAFPGNIAWEGSNVVWVPYGALNAFYRCQVDTGGVTSRAWTGPNQVAVSDRGSGASLFVVSATATDRFAYFVLPSTSAATVEQYDQISTYDLISIALSSDDFIYQGTDDGQVIVNQGGTIAIKASDQPFWGDHCRVDVWGGT